MTEVLRIGAVCVVGAAAALFLARQLPETGFLLSLAVCAVGAAALLPLLENLLSFLRALAAWGGMEEGVFVPLLKTAGIVLVSRVGTELCRDAGQGALASLLELGGAAGALLVALPLFQSVWELLEALL
ncbi:MAG: stage III sporulation protein AD [Oscillospiraceae bacterium]|nr:stage III sporulation protein AD [Oscillospiraceae bacterium]